MTYKTQEIIAKCLKQFDLRLFEEIGGNIQEKKTKWRKIWLAPARNSTG